MKILLYATSVLSFVWNKNGVAIELVKVTGWGTFLALGWGILMAPHLGNYYGPKSA